MNLLSSGPVYHNDIFHAAFEHVVYHTQQMSCCSISSGKKSIISVYSVSKLDGLLKASGFETIEIKVEPDDYSRPFDCVFFPCQTLHLMPCSNVLYTWANYYEILTLNLAQLCITRNTCNTIISCRRIYSRFLPLS